MVEMVTVNLSGGTLQKVAGNGGTFDIGSWNGGNNATTNTTGTLNQTGGSVINTVSDTHIGRDTGTVGHWNMSAGTATLALLNVGNNGNGDMTVTGPATTVTVGGEFNVGRTASSTGIYSQTAATLTVSGGAYIGREGGDGSFTQVGGTTHFNNNNGDPHVRVGWGAGSVSTLTLTGGGTIDTHNTWFGMGLDNGIGTATISGSGTSMTSRGIIVGWSGTGEGTLHISNNAVYTSTGNEVSIGRDQPTAVGIVNVLSGGSLTGTNFRIGHNGVGTLNINNGTVTSTGGDAIVADGGGSNGTVTMVNGVFSISGGSLSIAQNNGAQGSFTSTNSTTTVTGEMSVGRGGVNSDGFYTQTGGSLTVNNGLLVGRDGATGVFTQHGGTSAANSLFVGNGNANSNGTVNVDTGGTMAFSNEINIGINGGLGVVNLTGAGTLLHHTAGWLSVVGGRDGGGTGTMNVVNQATYTESGDRLFVGWQNGGHGYLNVLSGGTVALATGEFRVGVDAGSLGDVVVDGTGSSITVSNNTARIGEGGNGTLIVRNNGTFTKTGNGDTNIGANAGVQGTVTVESGGVFNARHFRIGGNNGFGLLNVTNGTVNTTGWTILATDGGSATGTINLNASAFNQDGDRVDIGRNGIGILTLSNGSSFTHINSGETNVGGNENGNGNGQGTVTIDATSTYSTTNFMRFGHGTNGVSRAQGVLNLNGGMMTLGGWMGFGHEGGSGTLNMTGGLITYNNEFYVGIDDNGRTTQTLGVANITGGSIIQLNAGFAGGGTISGVTAEMANEHYRCESGDIRHPQSDDR